MARSPIKSIVRGVLGPQHKEILDKICIKLGQSESETMRVAFFEYAKSISLVTKVCPISILMFVNLFEGLLGLGSK